MSRRKLLLCSGVVLLALVLVSGCSLLQRDYGAAPAADGWYIKLQVQAPGSKGITVTDFNVTGLNIQVRDPAGEVLKSIDWVVADGPKTYLVPVMQQGEHKIEVTHFGRAERGSGAGRRERRVQHPGHENHGHRHRAGRHRADAGRGAGNASCVQPDGVLGQHHHVGGRVGNARRNVHAADRIDPELAERDHVDARWADILERGLDRGLRSASLQLTGTISPDGSEINGTQSGFPFGGGSATFRMVRSTFSFGRLDLEGTCAGQAVSLHTDYGYARRSETIPPTRTKLAGHVLGPPAVSLHRAAFPRNLPRDR